ncbi:MAG: hypothetical protein NTW21_29480 [Verrucomicrobia bacterium]|nr:hypothetical protein [Verrucomicrobiota bacterium]
MGGRSDLPPQTVGSFVTKMKLRSYLTELRRTCDTKRMMLDAGIVALLIGLGFAVKPAYQAYRGYQVDRNLAAAKMAALHADWSAARDKARSVLLARSNDFEAFRIWSRACGKLGEPRAYMAAAQFFNDPRATRDDLLEALRLMALQAPHAMVLGAYGNLPENLRDQAPFRAAIIPLFIQRGEIAAAERGLREVASPTNEPEVRLEVLRTLCSRQDAGRVTQARGIFAELITAHADAQALAALRILGDVPGGLAPGITLPDLPAWLKDQPQATALHHLLGMHPALEAHPEQADSLYQAAIGRFLTSEPGVLGNWLVRHGQADLAVSVLTEPALTRSDAYLARLHALLRLDRTDEIVSALAAPPAAVDLVEMKIVEAIQAAKNGDRIAADSAWTRVLNQAAFDATRNRFIEIARVAEGCGAKDAAVNAWVAAVRLGWGPLPLYRDLSPVFASLAAQGRSDDLLAMCQTLLRFEPANPDLINDFHYLSLIHGGLPPDKIVPLQAKMAGQWDKPHYHVTLMLAEILAGRPTDALTCLPRFSDSKAVAPIMKAALEGCARVLAGETEAGTTLLKRVDWSAFMRQERIVFRDLLVKSKISILPIAELKSESPEADPEQTPAWRKAMERLQEDQAGDVLPSLSAPRVKGADWSTIPPEKP